MSDAQQEFAKRTDQLLVEIARLRAARDEAIKTLVRAEKVLPKLERELARRQRALVRGST